MSILILLIFLGAAVAAVPIAHALLLAALGAAATSDRIPLDLLVQQMVSQVQSFPLIAIPFFMLTGALMMGGRLGEALVGMLSTLVGRWHGGPAQVSVLSSTLFGGVSGSAVADASAIGSLLMPWHRRLGYPMAFSAASLASAALMSERMAVGAAPVRMFPGLGSGNDIGAGFHRPRALQQVPGAGVARAGGLVVFVKGGCPGDRVRARVFKSKKNPEILKFQILKFRHSLHQFPNF